MHVKITLAWRDILAPIFSPHFVAGTLRKEMGEFAVPKPHWWFRNHKTNNTSIHENEILAVDGPFKGSIGILKNPPIVVF